MAQVSNEFGPPKSINAFRSVELRVANPTMRHLCHLRQLGLSRSPPDVPVAAGCNEVTPSGPSDPDDCMIS